MTQRCADVVPLLGPLLDGELPPADAAWVDEHLAGCASCQQRKALLVAQAAALRERLQARAAEADLSRFADQVLARIQAERPAPLAERARVWLRETFGAHRLAFGAGASLAAAAALVAVVVGRPIAPQRVSAGQVVLASSALSPQGEAQIEELDVYGQEGTVLQFPGQTVIWVDDEPARPRRAQ